MLSSVSLSLITPDLHDPELDRVIDAVADKVTCPPKHNLAMPGEHMDFLWYVQSGCAKLFMDNGEGVTKMLYVLNAGWFYGETPCFIGVRTGLYFQTETKTVLYKISKENCNRLIVDSPIFRDRIMLCMAHKLLMIRHEVANLTFNSCNERIKRLLCSATDNKSLSEACWYNLHTHYTHQQIGEIVGAARVTVSRQITELCSEGFLRVVNRRMQVNAEKCRSYCAKNLKNRFEN